MPPIRYLQTMKPVRVSPWELFDVFEASRVCIITRENDFADVVINFLGPNGRNVHVPPANIAGIVYSGPIGESVDVKVEDSAVTSFAALEETRDLAPIPKNKGGRPKKA